MECDIRIKSPTYPMTKDLVIKHNADDTVLMLKSKIKLELANDSLLESIQKLIYAGHVLDDTKTLAQLSIPCEATFHLVTPPHIRPPGGDSNSQATNERSPSAIAGSAETIEEHGLSSEHNGATPIEVTENVAQNPVPDDSGIHGGLRHEVPLGTNELDTQQLLNSFNDMQRTNTHYDLCYIDGFPYLVRAAGRTRSRHSRARASPIASSASESAAAQLRSTNARSTTTAPVRHQHVDLPATAAIPVRTADGRRALILSPEGVRAMAAQGVNVNVRAANRGSPFGINSTSFRHFMRTGVPHAWLILKLAFLVAMLGANSSWTRFMILNAIAVVIFFWQSGILGAALGLNPAANPALAPAPAANPAVPAVDQSNHNSTSEPSRPETVAAAAGSSRTDSREVPLLQNLGRAFFSSIVPNVQAQQPAAPIANAAPEPSPPTGDTGTVDSSAPLGTEASHDTSINNNHDSHPQQESSLRGTSDAAVQDDAAGGMMIEGNTSIEQMQRDW